MEDLVTAELVKKALSLGAVQIPEEIEALVELVKSLSPKNILEIGSESGGTFYLWCRLTTLGGLKISLDMPDGSSGSGRFSNQRALAARSANFKRWSANVHCVIGDSHEQRTWQNVDDILGRGREKLDFLFIDGDHSYEGVKADFEDYKGFVRSGGLIAFHDIRDCEHHRIRGCYVAKFWQELKGEKQEIIDPLGYWGGIGVIAV